MWDHSSANGAPRIAYQFAGDSTDYRDGSQQPVSGEQPQQNYDPQTPIRAGV